ncbi:uncharacterized protein LOC110859827 [Folsomia candida]|uniref:uncharacterized protein LOC110859827 n=1 Tax=Folsomia candida TaxID=158441 RepID=UPI000B90806F|nr:uncharacterized protein LOC110859827 [Folsomia candida]
MNSKYVAILTLVIACIASSEGRVVTGRRIGRQLAATLEAPLTEGVQNNVINTLSRVAQATEVAGTNVSRAAAVLVRSIVREGFNLGSAATYLPRLLFLDGPNQFIETLRLIRSNRIQAIPNDMNSAIDNLITFTGSVRDSGITSNLAPIVEFFPNIFRGVEKFAQDVLYNAFAWIGPLPPPSAFDQTINKQVYRAGSTTESPDTPL